jgi:predicted metal-dependent phosphoesterase TrpH
MRFPRDWHEANRKLTELKKSGKYGPDIQDYFASWKNPLFTYLSPKIDEDEFLCSLHTHTDALSESPSGIFNLSQTAASRGYKIVAITNHSEPNFFEGRRVMYDKANRLFMVRGLECRCEDGERMDKNHFTTNPLKMFNRVSQDGELNDVVLIGYKGKIPRYESTEKTLKTAKESGALIIATSAGDRASKGLSLSAIEKHRGYFDAIEILNSNYKHSLKVHDILARRFAFEHDLPGIYVSDSHTLREIGSAGVAFKKQDFKFFFDNPDFVLYNPTNFLDTIRSSLKQGKYSNVGGYYPLFSIFYLDKIKAIAKESNARPFDRE